MMPGKNPASATPSRNRKVAKLAGPTDKAWRQVTTPQLTMPTALFVPAALGNKPARDFTAAFLTQGGQSFTPEQVEAFLGRLDATAARLAAMAFGIKYRTI